MAGCVAVMAAVTAPAAALQQQHSQHRRHQHCQLAAGQFPARAVAGLPRPAALSLRRQRPGGWGCSDTAAASGRRQVVVAAGTLREVPIFPLSMVALPAATVHLNIFEARYRVLFNTLLSGAENLEEGLIDRESPYLGSREFGMCYCDQNGNLSTVGTLLHIDEHESLEDGRMTVVNRGMQKFKIVSVVQERPVLICNVEYIEADDDSGAEVQELAGEVAELCRNTLQMSIRMSKMPAKQEEWDLPELRSLAPYELSCWVAYHFIRDPLSKQYLLEMTDTAERLVKEKDWLESSLKYLTAASALENAFKDEGA